jgi:hypothetical protein
VRDEKMLEKLATHEVKDISELFDLADKCVRAAKGYAWHSQPGPAVGKARKPKAVARTIIGRRKSPTTTSRWQVLP